MSAPSIDPVALLDRWASDLQDWSEHAPFRADRIRYSEQAAEFRAASRAVQAMLEEVEGLRARVADTDGAITVLGFQNAELRARVDELERQLDAATDVICDLGGELRWPDMIESERRRAALAARVAELEAERADDDALRERMSDILKRTAIALRGPEPPLTAWSWHDLPERAAAAIASIDLFQRVAHNLADPRDLQQGEGAP